jgi:cation transport regulator ChaB
MMHLCHFYGDLPEPFHYSHLPRVYTDLKKEAYNIAVDAFTDRQRRSVDQGKTAFSKEELAEFIERVSKLSNSANTLLFTGLTLQSMGRSGHLCDPYGLPSLFTVQPPLAETAQRQRTYYQNSLLSALLLKQCTQLKTIIKTQCPDTFLLSC